MTNMIQAVYNHLIGKSFSVGVYHFARNAMRNQPGGNNPTNAIILTLYIGIVTY
jgi:hypothetical protein